MKILEIVPKSLRLFLLLSMLTSNAPNAAITVPDQIAQLPKPEIDLKPEDVVHIVIDALADNDTPFADAGIATTFNFASPDNKVNTGPLKKFTAMVKGPDYGPMVNHLSSELSEVVYKDGMAYQMVKLIARDGAEIIFAFRLSQQLEGEFRDMWMTDAVWPISSQSSY